jgi:hypothetical protein
MAKDLGPHVVARAPKGEEAPAKREVEARPTCKLDKNELLGLVVKSSGTAEPVARRSKRHTDLDVSVEVVTHSDSAPILKYAKPRSNRVVQTVRRADVGMSEMAPLRVAPTGTDVSMPTTPARSPAKVTANDSADPFADMFAETLGATPTPTPTVRAATGSGTHPPLESETQDIPTEVAGGDFDAFGDTAMLSTAALPPPTEVAAPPLAEGSIVSPTAMPAPRMLGAISIDDTAPVQALVDAPIAAPIAEVSTPDPVVAEPVTRPVVVLVPVSARKRPFISRLRSKLRTPGLLQQIAIGVVLGCVGIGVYLGISAT